MSINIINKNIFRAYDIRGIYPKEIDEKTAELAGFYYPLFLLGNGVSKLKKRRRLTIFISRDARPSSPKLFAALKKGLLKSGAKIIDGGMTTTPMHYFCVNKTKADGGLMITASHQPAKYNGIKMTRRKAIPVSGEELLEFLEKQKTANLDAPRPSEEKIVKKDFQKEYVEFLLGAAKFPSARGESASGGKKPAKKLKIAADTGNGMAGLILRDLLKKLPVKFSILFEKPDCSFPNHEANPIKYETLAALKKEIKKQKADLGMAFDGDGDRVIFLNSKGEPIRPDLTLGLLASEYLKKRKGLKIVYDVRASKIVPETIKKLGGVPLKCRVGHKFFKNLLREQGVFFGGELSGHYYFKKFFNADSALFASLEILKIIISKNKSLEELISPFQKYFHSGELNFKIADKEKTMKEIKKRFKSGKLNETDGLTIEFPDWWFNLRPSANEPLLRLNIEARTRKILNSKTKLLAEILKKIK